MRQVVSKNPSGKTRQPYRTWLRTRALNVEDGRIFVLAIGLLALVLTLVMLCVGASAMYLEQKRLQRLADQVVVLSAEEISHASYVTGGAEQGGPIEVASQDAAARAEQWLASLDSGQNRGLESITIKSIQFPTPTQVRVELSAEGTLEFLPQIVSQFARVPLHATTVSSLKSVSE